MKPTLTFSVRRPTLLQRAFREALAEIQKHAEAQVQAMFLDTATGKDLDDLATLYNKHTHYVADAELRMTLHHARAKPTPWPRSRPTICTSSPVW